MWGEWPARPWRGSRLCGPVMLRKNCCPLCSSCTCGSSSTSRSCSQGETAVSNVILEGKGRATPQTFSAAAELICPRIYPAALACAVGTLHLRTSPHTNGMAAITAAASPAKTAPAPAPAPSGGAHRCGSAHLEPPVAAAAGALVGALGEGAILHVAGALPDGALEGVLAVRFGAEVDLLGGLLLR